MMLMYIMLES